MITQDISGPQFAVTQQTTPSGIGWFGIGWFGIVRLGAVQAAIGAMVMLVTSLLNRIMVVEYRMAAAIPAGLVAWHYAVQISRPLWGHRSDRALARTPLIIGGLCILSLGILMAVNATIMMAQGGTMTIMFAIVGFTLVGIGVGMSGTALLALLASRVAIERKPAAAAISWSMMIAGIVIAAGLSGKFLDPFSPQRLVLVCACVVLAAFCVAMAALFRLESNSRPIVQHTSNAQEDFRTTVHGIWCDAKARRFTYFVFLSMLAFSMQDLILEPFVGFIFKMTPGQSTQMASVQHGGVLAGMVITGLCGSVLARRYGPNVKFWIILGCCASSVMMAGLSLSAMFGDAWPIRANIFALGLSNGIFAVAAVGAMLALASDGNGKSEGSRMGVWGAAQAIAFGIGGLLGAVLVDVLRNALGQDAGAFQIVFAIESMLFLIAGLAASGTQLTREPTGEIFA